MSSVMDNADLHPARIPGYGEGLLTRQDGLLDEPLFWLCHLSSCAHGNAAEELLFGADYDAASTFQRRMWQSTKWPTFTVPLAGDHRLHVVHRTLADDPGTDYLLHHPDWEQAELLARDDGHFMGPGLSWPELVSIAGNALPGGSTTDPGARLLLLLPAFGDEEVDDQAVDRLTDALHSLTRVEDPRCLSEALLEGQGAPGPVRWTMAGQGFQVNDGAHSFRNPANRFALPADRLARVATALAP